MPDLIDSIRSEICFLIDDLTTILSEPKAVRFMASDRFRDRTCAPILRFLNDRGGGKDLVGLFAELAVKGDLLRLIQVAVHADGVVELEELRQAYEIVSEIAEFYARVEPAVYAQFTGMSRQNTSQFLTAFLSNPGWFGGKEPSTTQFMAIEFCTFAGILTGGCSLLDRIEDLFVKVVIHITGTDRLNSAERELISRFRGFIHEHRETVALLTQLDTGHARTVMASESRPSSVPTPDRPAQASAASSSVRTQEDALAEAIAELDGLIGLIDVKAEVRRLMNFLKVQQERKKHGFREASQSLHFVFTGNPGTGKTTVARILGEVFFGFGILKTPRVVECDRSALVGGYVGQTAIKTQERIEEALDGVLFIDEAYTLAKENATGLDSFGQEAIEQRLKKMEDHRDRLVVIVAGYPAEMARFIEANPGLESRFTRQIHFEDYSAQELCRIFDKYCRDTEYSLTTSACLKAFGLFSVKHARKNRKFGNARDVRNTYERVVSYQSDRLATAEALDKTQLSTIDAADIPYVPGEYEPQPAEFDGSKWEGECPGCGKVVKAGVKFLGQRVTCKCGNRHYFPWWNLVLDSVTALPPALFQPSRPADRLGIPDPKAAAHSKPSPPDSPTPGLDSASWRPDPARGLRLMAQGLKAIKEQDANTAIAAFEEAIRIDWPNSNPSRRPYYLHRAEAYALAGNDQPMNSLRDYNAGVRLAAEGQFRPAIQAYKGPSTRIRSSSGLQTTWPG